MAPEKTLEGSSHVSGVMHTSHIAFREVTVGRYPYYDVAADLTVSREAFAENELCACRA